MRQETEEQRDEEPETAAASSVGRQLLGQTVLCMQPAKSFCLTNSQ